MGTAARGLLPAAHPTEQHHILWMHVAGDFTGRMLSCLLSAAALERSSLSPISGAIAGPALSGVTAVRGRRALFNYWEDQTDLTWSNLSWMTAVVILRIYNYLNMQFVFFFSCVSTNIVHENFPSYIPKNIHFFLHCQPAAQRFNIHITWQII